MKCQFMPARGLLRRGGVTTRRSTSASSRPVAWEAAGEDRRCVDVESGDRRRTLRLEGGLGAYVAAFFRVSSSGFLFLPSSKTQFLRLDGKSYRGVFDIALNKNGRVTVVNELGMEEYLSGVVPAEIPPAIYPEPAGLAAQAVAARTYALKNMGRFSAEGFDLTDDVRTQVYGGVAIEKQPANEAVRSTQGLAIYYHGELINAMYSSTCGGRTEDFSNVFDGPPVPYLTSVSCTVESGAVAGTEVDLRGKNQLEDALFADDGSIANRYLELAVVLEVVAGIRLSPGYVGGQASEVEIKQWVSRACVLAGLPLNNDPASAKGGASRAGFIRFASESLFGPQDLLSRLRVLSRQSQGRRPGAARRGTRTRIPHAERPVAALSG